MATKSEEELMVKNPILLYLTDFETPSTLDLDNEFLYHIRNKYTVLDRLLKSLGNPEGISERDLKVTEGMCAGLVWALSLIEGGITVGSLPNILPTNGLSLEDCNKGINDVEQDAKKILEIYPRLADIESDEIEFKLGVCGAYQALVNWIEGGGTVPNAEQKLSPISKPIPPTMEPLSKPIPPEELSKLTKKLMSNLPSLMEEGVIMPVCIIEHNSIHVVLSFESETWNTLCSNIIQEISPAAVAAGVDTKITKNTTTNLIDLTIISKGEYHE